MPLFPKEEAHKKKTSQKYSRLTNLSFSLEKCILIISFSWEGEKSKTFLSITYNSESYEMGVFSLFDNPRSMGNLCCEITALLVPSLFPYMNSGFSSWFRWTLDKYNYIFQNNWCLSQQQILIISSYNHCFSVLSVCLHVFKVGFLLMCPVPTHQ